MVLQIIEWIKLGLCCWGVMVFGQWNGLSQLRFSLILLCYHLIKVTFCWSSCLVLSIVGMYMVMCCKVRVYSTFLWEKKNCMRQMSLCFVQRLSISWATFFARSCSPLVSIETCMSFDELFEASNSLHTNVSPTLIFFNVWFHILCEQIDALPSPFLQFPHCKLISCYSKVTMFHQNWFM
jgi:hypothetical protein